jgi:DNA-binding transcriptional LysR family regulator
MLNEMTAFVRAVDLKSISAAARDLRLSSAATSQRILNLEEKLGVRLLNRNTRRLEMTSAGLTFYDHALEVLQAVERAENSMMAASRAPAGLLRVTAPLTFGRRFLAPLISEFHADYPRMDIRLRLSDHVVDLVSESMDLALRTAAQPDSSLIIRRVGEFQNVVCAAPAYLDRRGRPARPEDLLGHDCLVLSYPGNRERRWSLTTPAGPVALPVSGRLDADAGDVLTEWALQGDGIVLKPWWEVCAHVRQGDLEVILPAFPPEPTVVSMVYPNKQLLPARMRLFADFLVDRIGPLLAAGEPPARRPADQRGGGAIVAAAS